MQKQILKQRDFVDQERKIMSRYYDLMKTIADMPARQVIKAFKVLTIIDPDFLDPYIVIFERYMRIGKPEKAIEYLDEAYKRALKLITDKDGNWPDCLEWGWLENRHIIRTLLNKALVHWNGTENDKSLDLLRKLLKSNPGDNIGARYYILAILEGFKTFESYEKKFNKGGFYDTSQDNWFDENIKKHKDEFDWWLKEVND